MHKENHLMNELISTPESFLGAAHYLARKNPERWEFIRESNGSIFFDKYSDYSMFYKVDDEKVALHMSEAKPHVIVRRQLEQA